MRAGPVESAMDPLVLPSAADMNSGRLRPANLGPPNRSERPRLGVLRRPEFHYLRKQAKWLNMVELKPACCAASASTDETPLTSAFDTATWERNQKCLGSCDGAKMAEGQSRYH
jgi:hypothetical protein